MESLIVSILAGAILGLGTLAFKNPVLCRKILGYVIALLVILTALREAFVWGYDIAQKVAYETLYDDQAPIPNPSLQIDSLEIAEKQIMLDIAAYNTRIELKKRLEIGYKRTDENRLNFNLYFLILAIACVVIQFLSKVFEKHKLNEQAERKSPTKSS